MTRLLIILATYVSFAILLRTDVTAQNPVADSLITELKTAKEDSNKVNTLFELIGQYYSSDADTSIIICKNALSISEKINYKTGMAEAFNWLAYFLNHRGDISQALEYWHRSLKIKQKISFEHPGDTMLKTDIATLFNNLGTIYNSLDNKKSALEYYYKSLKCYEDINDSSGIGVSNNNIGSIYGDKDQHLKAMDFFKKSLKIRELINDKMGIASSLYSLGGVYKNQAVGFQENNKIQSDSLFSLALEHYHSSLNIMKELGYKRGITFTLNAIGWIHLEQNNLKMAEEYCLKSLDLANELGYPENISNTSQTLYTIYKKKNNTRQALAFHELYTKMKDSINNIQTKKTSVQKQMQYEFAQKEAATLAEQGKKDAITLETLAKQKMQRNAFIGGFMLMLLLAGVVYRSYRSKQKANQLLSEQKAIIEEKNENITDSLHYARQIQQAMLPFEERFKEPFGNNYFIIYKPCDIVSGDFYWSTEKDGKIFLAVVDCTGHGVPGAFMSMVGTSALSNIVNEKNMFNAGEILSQLNKDIRIAFNQEEGTNRDGMDMVICIFDKNKNTIEFAGANNPLYLINNNELTEIKGDKFSIGGLQQEKERVFSSNTIKLKPQTTVYLSTDGYADQFGGEHGKKFKSGNFKKLLLSLHNKSMQEQGQALSANFEKWKGTLEQVDDVCVIGIRV
ncbi:MAG: tetratricopeptide repeat protein [Bacteroidota bacterium]|nr:tetratricopeptide repeat protein [Bacteroidota bacterium]